jgi:cytochrome c-type biogenesis protein CcmH/NrfG
MALVFHVDAPWDDQDALLALLAELMRRGELDEAALLGALVLRRHPRDARVWALVGAVSAAAGDHERALRACAIAVRLDPAIADALAATSS